MFHQNNLMDEFSKELQVMSDSEVSKLDASPRCRDVRWDANRLQWRQNKTTDPKRQNSTSLSCLGLVWQQVMHWTTCTTFWWHVKTLRISRICSRQCSNDRIETMLGSHRLHRCLLYDSRLEPKVAKTAPVRAQCGLTNYGDRSTCMWTTCPELSPVPRLATTMQCNGRESNLRPRGH